MYLPFHDQYVYKSNNNLSLLTPDKQIPETKFLPAKIGPMVGGDETA
jgi:hypothetical protein